MSKNKTLAVFNFQSIYRLLIFRSYRRAKNSSWPHCFYTQLQSLSFSVFDYSRPRQQGSIKTGYLGLRKLCWFVFPFLYLPLGSCNFISENFSARLRIIIIERKVRGHALDYYFSHAQPKTFSHKRKVNFFRWSSRSKHRPLKRRSWGSFCSLDVTAYALITSLRIHNYRQIYRKA